MAQWDTSAVVNGVDFDGLSGVGHLFPTFVGDGQIHELSSMDMGELNLRGQLPMPPGRLTASALVGVRYMDVHEQFDYLDSSTLPLPMVSTRTQNQMWGPQVGGLAQFFIEDCFWVDVEAKGAIFANDASTQTNLNGTNVPVVPLATSMTTTTFLATSM